MTRKVFFALSVVFALCVAMPAHAQVQVLSRTLLFCDTNRTLNIGVVQALLPGVLTNDQLWWRGQIYYYDANGTFQFSQFTGWFRYTPPYAYTDLGTGWMEVATGAGALAFYAYPYGYVKIDEYLWDANTGQWLMYGTPGDACYV